jgi:hypothetical protein
VLFDKVSTVVNEEEKPGKAVSACEINLMLQERLSTDGNHGFWKIAEPIFQARALASRQNDRLVHQCN